MYNVYITTDQAEWWLSQSELDNYVIFRDWDDWILQPKETRISLVDVVEFNDNTDQLVATCQQNSVLAIVVIIELTDHQWCKTFDFDNIVFFVSGALNYTLAHAQINFCTYWFWSTTAFYHSFPNVLSLLNAAPKHKYFDALLGRQKPHRDQIYDTIDKQQNIVKYFPSHQDLDITQYNDCNFAWPLEVLARSAEPVNFTAQEVVVNGVIVSLSQIIPVDIYNQTYYSLVAETMPDNELSFFTEKILKCLIAKRLFVVVAGQHYLKNLKALGFKTFSTVIDESYDLEPNVKKRTELALAQVEQLCRMDPLIISQQIEAILEHNFQLVMQTNWHKKMCLEIKNCVNKTLGET